MNIFDEDLLDGEELIQTKKANSVIIIAEHGLSQFAFDGLMGLVGMKGKEAIGGRLHLTNYRLLFKSHSFNRVKGRFSVFLPTIADLKDTSEFLTKKLCVNTQTEEFEFVVWGISAFMKQIQIARDAITPEKESAIRNAAATNFDKCGTGLKVFKALEAINITALTARKIADIAEQADNVIELAGVLNLMELFSDGDSTH